MYTKYKLDPTCKYDLYLCLYKNIKNIPELLIKAKQGSLDCALINPIYIYDTFQVVVAANKAVLSNENNTMKTRSVYSEVIYNLSPSKNIMKSLTTFGIKEQNSYPENGIDALVAILKQKDSEFVLEDTLSFINGESCPVDNVDSLRNINSIEKAYNVQGQNLLRQLVSIIASK